MPDQLQTIVQRMIDAGEPEENIATVVQHFKTSAAPSTTPRSSVADVAMMDNPSMGPLLRAASGIVRFAKQNPVATGAVVGGLAAGPLTGGASIPAGMAAAGLGAAGGAGAAIAGRQLVTGRPEPAGETVKTMATEGAAGAAGEGLGRAAAGTARLLGRGLYRTALSPTQPVLGKYGDVVGEGLATRTPVSKEGLKQAGASKVARLTTKDAALKAADQRVGFSADLIMDDASQPLSKYATEQVRAGLPDPSGDIGERLAQFKAANPKGSLTPSSLDAIKGTLDDTTGLAHRKMRMREPLTPTEKTSVEMTRAMGRANETAVPQYREMNRSIMDAEGLRRAIERRTLGSGGNQVLDTLLTLMRGPAGIPGRVAMMPPVMSRAGIGAHAVGEGRTLPNSLQAALIAAFGLSPDTPQD